MSVRMAVIVVVLGAALVGRGAAQSGASVRVTAQAEPMEVSVGEPVTLTVRVQGASATVVRTPDPPDVTNLEPQQRTPDSWQNLSSGSGGLRRAVTYEWRFQPRRRGDARIGPVEVVVRGETYTTGEIRLRVQDSAPQSSPTLTRPGASSRGDDDSTLNSRTLFIRAEATADRVYQNEQVVVAYRLFYRPDIRLRHSRLADAWGAPGFWREELNVASRPVPRTRRAYGQSYQTIVLKRVALFPTRPGTLRVDPLRIEAEAQGTLQLRGRQVRGRFEPVQLASGGLSVSVRPLPGGAPASFKGAVGTFGMTVRTASDSTTVGEPVQLTVQLRGTGNLATLSPPRLDLPSAFEVYDPSVETNIDRGGEQIGGTKTFTYTVVPRAGGRYSLPPVRFGYFDPAAERYETLRERPSPLHVTGSAAKQVEGRTGDGLPVGDITNLRGADRAEWEPTDRRPLHQRPWAYLALLVPVLVGAGGALYRRRTAPTQSSQTTERETGGDAAVPDRLHEARRRLQNGADAAFYDTLDRTLHAFLDERLDLRRGGATRTALDRALGRHDVPEEHREALYDLLDRCEEAQFAPEPPPRDTAETLLDDAQAVLGRLDENLPVSPGAAGREHRG